MTIITTPQPATPARTPRKAAANKMLQILGNIMPEYQLTSARVVVEIGGTKTFWSQPEDKALPPFLVGSQGGQSKLFLLSPDGATLTTYYGKRDRFRRGEVITDPAEMLSVLPRYALNEHAVEPATEAQLKTIKKHFNFTPSTPMTRIAASRVLDALVLEGDLPQLWRDVRRWQVELNSGKQQQALALTQ